MMPAIDGRDPHPRIIPPLPCVCIDLVRREAIEEVRNLCKAFLSKTSGTMRWDNQAGDFALEILTELEGL